jgi:hypothetical protein
MSSAYAGDVEFDVLQGPLLGEREDEGSALVSLPDPCADSRVASEPRSSRGEGPAWDQAANCSAGNGSRHPGKFYIAFTHS